MHGRYVSVARQAELLELYRATGLGDGKELALSFTVAPTSKVYAVVERLGGRGRGRARRARGALGPGARLVETGHRPEDW